MIKNISDPSYTFLHGLSFPFCWFLSVVNYAFREIAHCVVSMSLSVIEPIHMIYENNCNSGKIEKMSKNTAKEKGMKMQVLDADRDENIFWCAPAVYKP